MIPSSSICFFRVGKEFDCFFSGTTMNIKIAINIVIVARIRNIVLQSVYVNAISRGAVAATAPRPPAARKVPLMTGQCFSLNHKVEAFIDAIKQPATPSPIKPRLVANPSMVSACANKKAPNAAKNKRKV